MIARFRILLIGIAVFCMAASCAWACKLPVFRYALERWPADRYKLVAIVDEATRDDAKEAVSQLMRLGDTHANVDVETIDLSKLSEQQLWQVEGLDGSEEPPLLQVFFPPRDGQRKLCWSGEFTPASVAMWRDSPLRRQIFADVTSGVSAVWILVEGSDAAENERMANQLDTAIARAEAEISIPDGVISREAAAGYLQQHPGASMDDVLRSDIPLRIDFAMRRLQSGDDEPALRAMVAGWNRPNDVNLNHSEPNHSEPNSSEPNHAFVFPVFGRGRMIEPLSADRLSVEAVVGACRYMVGECNCTLKALNPGVDLLLDANWKDFMDETLVVVDPSLPTTPQPLTIPSGTPTQDIPSDPSAAEATGDAISRTAGNTEGRWIAPAAVLGSLVCLGALLALARARRKG